MNMIFQSFKEPHKNSLLVYNTNKDICFGEAILYENDIIRMKWLYKQGKRWGNFCVFEDGIIKYQSSWDKDEQWNYQPIIENTESGKMLLLFDSETYRVIFRGEFNPNSYQRHGWGCEYDRSSGAPLFCGRYENDSLMYKEKVFHEDGKMTVYSYSPSTDRSITATNLKPVIYRGDFLNCFEKRYPCHGQGIQFNVQTHQACWKGLFEMDQAIEGVEINEEGWFNICTSPQTVEQQLSPVSPPQPLSLEVFPKTVTSIDIVNGSGNDQTCVSVDFSSFTELKTLRIGSQSFLYTSSFCCSKPIL